MNDLEQAYLQYRGMVYRFLMRLSGSPQLSEELTQETFYRAAVGKNAFRGEASPSTYLCGIAKNLYRASLRRPAAEAFEDHAAARPDFTDALVERDRAMVAQRLLHCLPEPYKEVFTLRTYCELSHRDIGALFEKSEAWSRVTYHRARGMLQNAFEEEENVRNKK